MKMTFTASGDALITKHIPQGHKGFSDISKYIQKAEARITNLEVVLFNFDCFASTFCGGTWLGARPGLLKDLIKYGFNLYSWANNHTLDYSYDGLLSTQKYLNEANLANAGAGKDLNEASKPAIIDLPSGSAGLISICSTNADQTKAGKAKGTIPGRPGLNPLRFSTEYIVTPNNFKTLETIAEKTKMNGRVINSMEQGYTPKNPEGTLYFGGLLFREGKEEGKITKVNPVDMERTEQCIKQTLNYTNHVVVAVHSHECKGNDDFEPDYFIEEFSHRCIDAGASGVVGTGTHQLRPIEIYKNRPIFYSLGNFIFHSDSPENLPADFNEKYGYLDDIPAKEAISIRSDNGRLGLHSMEINFRSIIPYWEINNGVMTHLELLPINLGFNLSSELSGFPSKDTPHKTLEYLKTISKPYGTAFKENKGLILVDI